MTQQDLCAFKAYCSFNEPHPTTHCTLLNTALYYMLFSTKQCTVPNRALLLHAASHSTLNCTILHTELYYILNCIKHCTIKYSALDTFDISSSFSLLIIDQNTLNKLFLFIFVLLFYNTFLGDYFRN